MTVIDTDDDRRVRRTKLAIFDAFRDLVLTTRYDEIRISDILDRADIGKSTFYTHFKNKDDVLLTSMAPLLEMMVSPLSGKEENETLEFVLAHFWQQRALARIIFANHLFFALVRALATVIEEKLADQVSAKQRPLVALDIASSQFAIIKAWLAGEVSYDVKHLAAYLEAQMRGRVNAATS
jgi:AcrR family transcriptional regulator